MAPRRLSRLQRHILKCLMAQYQRTRGGTILGHYELVQALGHDKSNISHSLRTLEAQGLIVISRTPGGQANSVTLTFEGRNVASELK
jgi:DNA-binding MarR family transcriptional regulator